jgi:hypothetical protein
MAMNLAREDYAFNPDHLIAGVNIPIETAVKTAAEAIAAGAPVILGVSGLTNVVEDGGTVSTTGLYGIAAESAAQGEDVVVYLTGEFFADALALQENVTVDHVEVPFRNLGIFLTQAIPSGTPGESEIEQDTSVGVGVSSDSLSVLMQEGNNGNT